MAQQNARLNTDLDNKITSSYHDGTDWYMQTKAKDGAISSLGATTDAEATGNGTLIGIIKRIRTLFGGGLPAALSGNGNLKTVVSEPLPSGTNTIGTVSVNQLPTIPAGDNNIGNVDIISTPADATQGAAVPNKAFAVAGSDGTNARQLKTDTNGELQVDILSSALPAGAATSAKQDNIISYIDALESLLTAIRDTAGIKKIVDALPTGDNNIGNVDVVSSALPTGASTSAKQDTIISAVDGLENLITEIKDTDGIKKITDTVNTLIKGNQLRETQIGTDQTITWANSDAANTQKTVTFTKPAIPVSEYELIIYNPSTITDITVKIFNVETALGGSDRDALLTSVTIPKAQAMTGTTINTHIKLISGVFNGGDCKLVLSNDTVLGASDSFSAYVRLREVI